MLGLVFLVLRREDLVYASYPEAQTIVLLSPPESPAMALGLMATAMTVMTAHE